MLRLVMLNLRLYNLVLCLISLEGRFLLYGILVLSFSDTKSFSPSHENMSIKKAFWTNISLGLLIGILQDIVSSRQATGRPWQQIAATGDRQSGLVRRGATRRGMSSGKRGETDDTRGQQQLCQQIPLSPAVTATRPAAPEADPGFFI